MSSPRVPLHRRDHAGVVELLLERADRSSVGRAKRVPERLNGIRLTWPRPSSARGGRTRASASPVRAYARAGR